MQIWPSNESRSGFHIWPTLTECPLIWILQASWSARILNQIIWRLAFSNFHIWISKISAAMYAKMFPKKFQNVISPLLIKLVNFLYSSHFIKRFPEISCKRKNLSRHIESLTEFVSVFSWFWTYWITVQLVAHMKIIFPFTESYMIDIYSSDCGIVRYATWTTLPLSMHTHTHIFIYTSQNHLRFCKNFEKSNCQTPITVIDCWYSSTQCIDVTSTPHEAAANQPTVATWLWRTSISST